MSLLVCSESAGFSCNFGNGLRYMLQFRIGFGGHVVNILSSDGERMSMISSMNFRWFELCLIVMIDRC